MMRNGNLVVVVVVAAQRREGGWVAWAGQRRCLLENASLLLCCFASGAG